ncbi:uncharacterized protein BP5553_10303 [Venustampulla echinocandica]|uniref:Uncharacterized protein n=1 Tax=Venustampulla echinocandica TaxID=2656787 RepID=A0A370T9V3_9HELO|nr:uncharacterized protein BP5553_10303 [Venustampulla echinocandica]RDL30425.1 hypothetical protein BP5553_10303 [Venustampulla echinocandica]
MRSSPPNPASICYLERGGDNEMRDSITEIELDQDKIIRAIIIPNDKEDIDGLRETLNFLASHPQARSVYDVYLAMETREQGAEVKALGLISKYMKETALHTFHNAPSDIPGEAPGKGSNSAWATRKLIPGTGTDNPVFGTFLSASTRTAPTQNLVGAGGERRACSRAYSMYPS